MRRKSIIFAIALTAVFVPFILSRPGGTNATAVKRIIKDVTAAKSKLPFEHEGGGLPHLEQYIRGLKAIDLTGAPSDFGLAFSNYVTVLENNATVRRNGGNTNSAMADWERAE